MCYALILAATVGAFADQPSVSPSNDWWPILERLRTSLQSKNGSRRAEAEKALLQVNDRRAVPMAWATFGHGDASLQQLAVQVLGQINDPSAARSVAMLAVFGGSADVRRQAIDTLRRRDPREFAGLLIDMIQKPIRYAVKQGAGPGQPVELVIKGEGSTPDMSLLYPPVADSSIPTQTGFNRQLRLGHYWQTRWCYSTHPAAQGQSTSMLSQSGLAPHAQRIGLTMVSRHDEYFLYTSMSSSSMSWPSGSPMNDSTTPAVTMVQGQAAPAGQMGVGAPQTVAGGQRQLQNDIDSIVQFNSSLSEINDRVVPVVNDISGLKFGSDTVAWRTWLNDLAGINPIKASEPATKAGTGWVRARDLKVGDAIHTVNGTVKVGAIKDGGIGPVFNLEVADAADFFVGEVGALAHDNTVPDLRETPFDAVATPGHSEGSSRK